ncbi:MAG: general secretion pathway protein GspK [Nitrospirae bacterium]|nr:general secretion pathway protein GspK [Nitrospirota bacterium]
MRKSNQKGAALILVLWVVVLLTAIVTEFVFFMRTEANIARNFKEETEAYYAALSGIELAKEEILSAKAQQIYLKENGELILDEKGEPAFGEKRPERKGALGNSVYSYVIIDEDRKININAATPEQLRHIFKNSGAEDSELDTIIDSILDWRDPDNLHRLNGAEEDYYQSLPKPYSCKDGYFDTVEELLMVKGVKPEMLFGSKDGAYRGIAEYLTAKSSHIININTADRVVLEAKFGTAVAENIIMQRSAGTILTPMAGGIVNSTYFTIVSTGSSGKIKRTIKAIVMKKNDTTLETLYWNDNWLEKKIIKN